MEDQKRQEEEGKLDPSLRAEAERLELERSLLQTQELIRAGEEIKHNYDMQSAINKLL